MIIYLGQVGIKNECFSFRCNTIMWIHDQRGAGEASVYIVCIIWRNCLLSFGSGALEFGLVEDDLS